MAVITLTLPYDELPVTGKLVTFRSPCSSENVTGIKIGEDTYSLLTTARTPVGNAFHKGVIVSVLLDVEDKVAFLQSSPASLPDTPDSGNSCNLFIYIDSERSTGSEKYATHNAQQIREAVLSGKTVYFVDETREEFEEEVNSVDINNIHIYSFIGFQSHEDDSEVTPSFILVDPITTNYSSLVPIEEYYICEDGRVGSDSHQADDTYDIFVYVHPDGRVSGPSLRSMGEEMLLYALPMSSDVMLKVRYYDENDYEALDSFEVTHNVSVDYSLYESEKKLIYKFIMQDGRVFTCTSVLDESEGARPMSTIDTWTLDTSGVNSGGGSNEGNSASLSYASVTLLASNWRGSNVKSQFVAIEGMTSDMVAKVDCLYEGDGSEESFSLFCEAQDQYLLYVAKGFARTVDGGITFYVLGDVPTLDIPLYVETNGELAGGQALTDFETEMF